MSGITLGRERDILGLVDVQPTFMPGGELPVAYGDAVVRDQPAAQRLTMRLPLRTGIRPGTAPLPAPIQGVSHTGL